MVSWRFPVRKLCLLCRPDSKATLDDETTDSQVRTIDVRSASTSTSPERSAGGVRECGDACSLSSARRVSAVEYVDDDEEERACWICLDNVTSDRNPLASVCGCRKLCVHKLCLAQWQLHKAGTPEEKQCRFCHKELPDWKTHLDTEGDEQPVMCVSHQGKSHYIFPQPGEAGLQQFRERVASILGLDSPSMVCLIFDCIDPFSGSRITLKGAGAYDAALHCASVAAARRRQRRALVRSSSSPVKQPTAVPPVPGTGSIPVTAATQ